MNCPFCKPEIELSVFARSSNFRAIYNLAPVFPGHSLIIPVKHIESIFQLSDEQLCELILFSKKVAELLIDVFDTHSFNLSIQDQEAAGQTIAHLHLHILPRRMGDMSVPGDWYPEIAGNYDKILDSEFRPKLSIEETQKIVTHLRKKSAEKGII